MVIHDMRNPTNSIEFAVKEVIKLLALVNRGPNESNADNKSHGTLNNEQGEPGLR